MCSKQTFRTAENHAYRHRLAIILLCENLATQGQVKLKGLRFT